MKAQLDEIEKVGANAGLSRVSTNAVHSDFVATFPEKPLQ